MLYYYRFGKIMFRLIFATLLFVNSLYAVDLSKEKHFGVEVNPFYLFISASGSSDTYLSGTISYFDHKNVAEIAIPLHYMNKEYKDYKQFTVDVHYRKYIHDTIGGFYYGGFTRLAKLEGEGAGYSYIKQTKLGFGGTLGFRLFHNRGFYWGASLSLGSYITGDNEQFIGQMFEITDDQKFIIDIELFKFGYTF